MTQCNIKNRNHKKNLIATCSYALLFLVITGILMAILYIPVDRFLEQKLKAWLYNQGIEAEFAITHLTTNKIKVENLRLSNSESLALTTAIITYNIEDLRNKKVNNITLDGLNIVVSQTEDGQITVRGLEPIIPVPSPSEKEDFQLPDLPFETLQVSNAHITFKPYEAAAYTMHGDITLRSDYTGNINISKAIMPVKNHVVTLSNITLTRPTLAEIYALHVQSATINDASHLAIGTIDVTFSMEDVLARQINTLELSKLHASIAQNKTGQFTIKGLEDLAFPTKTETPDPVTETKPVAEPKFELPELPFKQVTIKDMAFNVTPYQGETITASGNMRFHSDYSGALHITEASVPLKGEEFLFTNFSLNRSIATEPFAMNIENITHITAKKAYFAPLKIDGTITPARDMQDINGTIHIQDLRELWRLNLNVHAALNTGDWKLNFEQPVMNFETGILQPDMIFPVLRGAMQQVKGEISASGSLSKKGKNAIKSEGRITFSNMDAVIKDIPVNGVNGDISLSSLVPPASRGQQTVKINEIVLGLPLSKGQMQFALDKSGKATFDSSTWHWAGGTLKTGGATLNIYKPELPDITLSAKNIALEELLSGLLQKGISATGQLTGVLPVTFTKEREAMIIDGELHTEQGGIIRYKPQDDSPLQKGGSMQTDILLAAIENFHYSVLSMSINSKDAHALEVMLHLEGNNPELYNGQKIILNINLNGNLLDIVQSGMNVYTLPERLQEQLMQ